MLVASSRSSRIDGSGTSMTNTRLTAAIGTIHSASDFDSGAVLTTSAMLPASRCHGASLGTIDCREHFGNYSIKFWRHTLPNLHGAIQNVGERGILHQRNALPACNLFYFCS